MARNGLEWVGVGRSGLVWVEWVGVGWSGLRGFEYGVSWSGL